MLTEKQLANLTAFARAAVRSERICGVPAEVTVAQAVLESGWGSRMPGNNCFGIKAATRHTATQRIATHECEGGEAVPQTCTFAAYDSLDAAFEDHAWLLANGKPYRTAFDQYLLSEDLVSYVHAIAPVYATDPTYAAKVQSIIAMPPVKMAITAARAQA